MTRFVSLRPSMRLSVARYVVLCTFLFLMPTLARAQPKKPIEEPVAKYARTVGDALVEVRFTDSGILKLSIREERIELMTPYGKLYIPLSDIKRIEFGLRIPEEVSKRVEAAITDLGNPQFRRREAAGVILLGLREKAYPAVVRATKSSDMEIANRAEELVKKFQETVPEELLKVRDYDIIYTENSKIAGNIESASLRANTNQFGEVQLRLADVHIVSFKGTESDVEIAQATTAPVNMVNFQNELGKTFNFRVTGNSNGAIWGTDVYSTDSTLGTVAVHAGLLQPGQTGVVKVTIMPSPNAFVGSTRNGITSAPYQQYPAAYRVHK